MRATLLALFAAAAFVAVDRFRDMDRTHTVRVETRTEHSESSESWNWQGNIAAGGTLEIRAISGSIRVEPASGSQVEVTAEKSGSDLANVRIAVVQHADGVTICAVYQGEDDDCGRGGDHTNVHGDVPEVDFVARVPAGVGLRAASVSGDVTASGLTAPVEVNSVSGDVSVEDARGNVTAHSVSGDVSLQRVDGRDVSAQTVSGDVDFSGPIRAGGSYQLKTLSGDLSVSPDGALDARISVSTFSGELDSDFPVTLTRSGGESHGRRFQFTTGRGNAQLALESFSGTIFLREGGAGAANRAQP